jgi:toxin-antitoxin system PIN domain toxin
VNTGAVLLDVNVLLPLLWDKHVHHQAAHAWFSPHEEEPWATCPLTQCGFVRVSSNPAFHPEPMTVAEAIEALHRATTHRSHTFWEDSIQLIDARYIHKERLHGHKQITDAYLAGLVIQRAGRFVTFDRAAANLFPADQQHRVILLTA